MAVNPFQLALQSAKRILSFFVAQGYLKQNPLCASACDNTEMPFSTELTGFLFFFVCVMEMTSIWSDTDRSRTCTAY